jgi:hypothetical protein
MDTIQLKGHVSHKKSVRKTAEDIHQLVSDILADLDEVTTDNDDINDIRSQYDYLYGITEELSKRLGSSR